MKRLAAVVLALVLTFAVPASAKNISEPKGFDSEVYHASFALSVTSEEGQIEKPRFLCTVTAYKKVKGGYLLIGAGHCTSANEALPSDMKYFVSEDINSKSAPVQLLKAERTEEYDYAIYFFPTKNKYPTISLGDERDLGIGDVTVDANFSLGVTKMVSPGVVVSQESTGQLPKGYFLVQQFVSHGASGSVVVSEKTHKIVGLVIAGWDGATMPTLVEGTSHINEELKKLYVVYAD